MEKYILDLSTSFRKKPLWLLLILTMLLGSWSVTERNEEEPMVDFLREYLKIKYKDVQFERFIYVAAKRQKLYLIDGEGIEIEYSISTSKKGIGAKTGSYQTPQGLHSIAEKVGSELEAYSVIKNKMPTGSKANVVKEARATQQDLITSRILHLKGLEPNVNLGEGCDSYSRGIFIHGTHEEGLLGTAASKGCVRMSNADVIDLFNRVEVGTFVVILNN